MVGSPAGSRRPLIRTSVREGPRPRKSTLAVPVAAFESMGHVVDHVFDRHRMLELDVLRSDDIDRAGAFEVRRRNACPRNGDLLRIPGWRGWSGRLALGRRRGQSYEDSRAKRLRDCK